jgi:hypothetical protein
MFKVLESTLSFVIKGKDISLKVSGFGGSYTDGKNMHIGLSKDFKGLPLNIIYMMTIALIGHEGQHVLSSNFEEFKKYNEEEVNKLVDKGVSRRFASHYVHSVGNIIEDGRIENILVNRLPGFIPKIQYLNMFFWSKREMNKDNDEFSVFISTMLSLSVLGIYPKNYNVFNGSKVDKEIEKIKPLIFKGIKATTCKDGLNVCREILSISEPFILDLYKDIKQEEELREQIMEMLKEFLEEHEGSSEEDYNDSQKHSSHIQVENQDEEKEGNSSSNSEKSEEEKNESASQDEDSKNSSSDSKEDDKQDSKGNSSSNSQKEDKVDSKGNSSSDSQKEDKVDSKENSSGDSKKEDDSNSQDEDIEEKMKSLAEKLKEEAEKDIKKEEKRKNKRNKSEKNKEDYSLPKEEAKKIAEKIHSFSFEETPNDFPLKASLPVETKTLAKKFKRQVKDIFNSKNRGSVSCQEKGVLDTDNIFRVGMGNYNVFKTEVVKNGKDHVLYFLRDGSGSMMGHKDMSSILSLAIMEEGLKGVVPFKAVTFYCGAQTVKHRVIKDWKDKSKKNYAYNYIQKYSATGGNMDSVSIEIASKELLRRPEKDKTLIILSDGLPYSMERTKKAIKDSRDKGINVIGIMFGSEGFRRNNLTFYKDMYQKNIIATSVDKIPNKLVKVLKEVLKY